MSRKIDEKKTRRALRRLARARRAAEEKAASGADLSEWEGEFLSSVETRLETFGSAFNDPEKGDREEALSARQSLKLREIEKKAKGKALKPMSRGTGFKRKGPPPSSRSRDINDDLPDAAPGDGEVSAPAPSPEERRAGFRVVGGSGGKAG